MRKYIIIDKSTGDVLQTMRWADNRDFPDNIILNVNEEVITIDSESNVDLFYTYDFITKEFYVLDVDDLEMEKYKLECELKDLDLILPILQEETWKASSIDESKLSQEWQDRLNRKREIRKLLNL